MKPTSVRCTGVDRKGLQCGRRVIDGSNPPLCHKHRPSAQPMGIVAQQATEDIDVLLRRLLKDRDPGIRLRAIEAIQKREERQNTACPRCSVLDDSSSRFSKYATLEEADRMLSLIQQMNDLRDDVLAAADAGREPSNWYPFQGLVHTSSPAQERFVAQPETERPAEPVAAPFRLPKYLWKSVGIYVVNKVPTCTLGDEHAEKILSGEIPFEDARVAQQRRQKHNVNRTTIEEHNHEEQLSSSRLESE